jgi:hypothetical protein
MRGVWVQGTLVAILFSIISPLAMAARSRVDCEIIVGSSNRQPPDSTLVDECFQQSAELEKKEAERLVFETEAQKKQLAASKAAQEKQAREWRKRGGVSIGMSQKQVLGSNWGRPEHVNRTITARGVREQWVYGRSYLYFEDGVLTTIQN